MTFNSPDTSAAGGRIMTTPRERVEAALNHGEPDHVPLDLGASAVTGMHVSSVYLLRQALGLDAPGTPVKVVEPYQMLGEIAPDLMDAPGVDVVGLGGPRTLFGFVDDFIDAGFDILNPVQCSAAGMDQRELKMHYGERISFWGGGVDTQKTLPFGTPEEVRAEAAERIRIFGRGGGFIFNTIHNVQARIPVENLLALYETVEECRNYPLT